MTPRSPSPSLIKGIDGIISRHCNEVNYSTLNGKNMETVKQPGHETRIKSLKKKHALLYNYFENKAKTNSKTKILNQRGNENETELNCK